MEERALLTRIRRRRHIRELTLAVTFLLANVSSDAEVAALNDQVDDMTMNPGVSEIPYPAYDGNDTLCEPYEATVIEMEGILSSTDPDPSCGKLWLWILDAPEDHGMTFQFHEVQLMQGRTLEIHSFNDTQQKWQSERLFLAINNGSNVDVNTNMSPLLVNNSRVKITVSAVLRKPDEEETPTLLNISFFAHLQQAMPQRITSITQLNAYDCSYGPIPIVLRCNMVWDCENGEDEDDCEYRKQGCEEGWVPYGKQCLTVHTSFSCHLQGMCSFVEQVGSPYPTLADNGEKLCRMLYDATLAAVPDALGLSLVTSLVRQSGFRSVSLAVRKYRPANRKLKNLYRHTWQWGSRGSPIAYHQQDLENVGAEHDCAMLDVYPLPHFLPTDCDEFREFVYPDGFVCSKPNPTFEGDTTTEVVTKSVTFARAVHPLTDDGKPWSAVTKECSDGSLVHIFDQCTWPDRTVNATWSLNNFILFKCKFGLEVHYALVCDGKKDCADGSDEADCDTSGSKYRGVSSFVCEIDKQSIDVLAYCDGDIDCFDETDENDCSSCGVGRTLCLGSGCIHMSIGIHFPSCPQILEKPVPEIPVPGVVRLHSTFGISYIEPVDANDIQFLFECSPGFYLPSYLLGNGEVDCPDGRDEQVLPENTICPGFYRCQGYGNCLHPELVCDSSYQCPNKDDEIYCHLSCPPNCTCEGNAFACRQMFRLYSGLAPRYLDMSSVTDISFEGFQVLQFLQLLNLSRCSLVNITIPSMPGLKILDLSFNKLSGLPSFILSNLVGLNYLDLTGNPLSTTIGSTFSNFLSKSGLINLNTLILQRTEVQSFENTPFSPLSKLTTLDLRGSPVESYGAGVFEGLKKLTLLYADDSKLCCPYFHPKAIRDCKAPVDELSSCSDLLRNNFFRVALWVMAVLAVLGNTGVILFRVLSGEKGSPTFRVLVINLCAADLLMGVYIVIIGSADVHYRDVYVSAEREWRRSGVCATAGFLAFVSNEVSAFVICLITLDRLLVIGFPLKRDLHLTAKVTTMTCCGAWLLAAVMAAVPLFTQMEFYDLNAVCLPLPITRQQFTGQGYAFGVFILLNFLLILLIASGQLFIYRAIRKVSSAAGTQRREQETSIARGLFLVVLSDFCCWFPVGMMGLLASSGVPISSEVNVWAAIFVLPINSALNPFLYTLNGALEQRRKRRLAEKTKRMIGNLQTEIPKWTPSMVEETVRICIKTKHVQLTKVEQWLGVSATASSDHSVSTDRTTRSFPKDNGSSQVETRISTISDNKL